MSIDSPAPGDTDDAEISIRPYTGPAGGWGSVRAVGRTLTRQQLLPSGVPLLLKQNKAQGFMCPSCAWAKPAHSHPFEFCENGAKAATWEATQHRAGPEFFATHPVSSLEAWRDHDLEMLGRLTHPMRWNAQTDKYEEVSWSTAFAEIGAELRKIEPKAAVFYASSDARPEA
ncbi:MAG: hypothetical protein SXG53_18150 [Pseudomonadota bacterium]|nr:hypothetical protein [Pseudomonadota bacterium]